MKIFKDFLEWYNNLDVLPFIEAVEKIKTFYKLVALTVRPVMCQCKHGGRGALPWGVKPRWSSDRTALWGPFSAVPYACCGRHDVHATHTLTRSSTPCP